MKVDVRKEQDLMEQKQWLINGEVFMPKIIDVAEKPKFKDTHTRVTTYFCRCRTYPTYIITNACNRNREACVY